MSGISGSRKVRDRLVKKMQMAKKMGGKKVMKRSRVVTVIHLRKNSEPVALPRLRVLLKKLLHQTPKPQKTREPLKRLLDST